MKKKLIAIISLILCLTLCACGSADSAKPVEKNDAGFLTNLSRGLEARWHLSDTTDYESDEDYPAYITGLINAELEALGSFSDYTFTNPELEALAKQYFDALNSQIKGAPYYVSNYEMYDQVFFAEGYNVRAKVLGKLVSDFGLTVSEEHNASLAEFQTLAESFLSIDALIQQPLVMTNLGDDVEMVIENTSGRNLQQVMLDARFLDDDGVVVGEWTEFIDNWDAGSKNKLLFNAYDLDYSSIELRINVSSENYATEWVTPEFVNEMVIEIVADNLNTEVDYGYGFVKMGACKVDDFQYEISHWNEGEGHVKLFFSGVRTSAGDDETTPGTHVNFTFVLLDEAGNVVTGGTPYVDNIDVGQRFENIEGYPGNLKPGTYHLVFENYYLTF